MVVMVKLIVALFMALAIVILPLLMPGSTMASPYGVGKYDENVPYGGQTALSISTSGQVTLAVSPTDSGSVSSTSGTVTVVSTDVMGYKLYIRSIGSTDMTQGASVIPASANGSPAALSINTWGYNLDGSANYVGATLSDILIRSTTQPYSSGDVTTVTYGVNVDNTKAAGNYSTDILYTAVPQTN